MALFDRVIAGLRAGDAELGLPAAHDATILDGLSAAEITSGPILDV